MVLIPESGRPLDVNIRILHYGLKLTVMLKRLIKDTFLQFKRFPLGTFINLTGMTIGIGMFLLIVIHLGSEMGIHKNNPRKDDIVRIANGKEINGWKGTPAILGEMLQENLPEVEAFVRFDHPRKPYTIKIDNEPKKLGKVGYADSTLFKIFPQRFLVGDPLSCLDQPYSMVLTESNAYRLFGRTDLVGETVLVDNKHNFRIMGIVEDPNNQTHLDADAYISFHSMPLVFENPELFECMGCFNYDCFLLLNPNLDHEKAEKKINDYIHEYGKQYSISNLIETDFLLEGLDEVYFRKEAAPSYRKGNKTQLSILSAVGFLILLMVLINYVNLSNAQSNSSIHELAIRKALGANKYHLVLMKLFESLALALISTGLGFLFMLLLKPAFADVLGVQYPSGLSGMPELYLLIPIGAILWGILAGIYPAFNITRLGSSKSLQLIISDTRGRSSTRKILTIIQLGMAILLIICTSMVFLQMNYTKNTNLGFESDLLLYMPINSEIKERKDAFRQVLLSNPSIKNVSYTYGSYRVNTERWGIDFRDATIELHMEFVDEYYLQTLGLNLIEGRDFIGPSDKGKIIINETAKKAYFGDEAVGTIFDRSGQLIEIIGVVSDFHFMSFHSEVQPLAMMYSDTRNAMINVRFKPGTESQLIPFLETTWADFVTAFPFDFKFVSDYFNSLYLKEIRLGQLFIFFSLISVFIAGLGIYGLITFLVLKRIKEITVRKINGATVFQILGLFFKELSWMVIFASLPAFILSGYLMNKWYENFTFHVDFPIYIFPGAMALVWLITLATSFGRSLKAARINPAVMLRRP